MAPSSRPNLTHSGLSRPGRGTFTVAGGPRLLTSSPVSGPCPSLFPLRVLKLGHQLPLVPTRAVAVGVDGGFSLAATFPASHSWEMRRESVVRWAEV